MSLNARHRWMELSVSGLLHTMLHDQQGEAKTFYLSKTGGKKTLGYYSFFLFSSFCPGKLGYTIPPRLHSVYDT